MAYTGPYRVTKPVDKPAWKHPYCFGVPSKILDVYELRKEGTRKMLQMGLLCGIGFHLFHTRFIPIPKTGILRFRPFGISRALTVPLVTLGAVDYFVHHSLVARQTVCSWLEDMMELKEKRDREKAEYHAQRYEELPTAEEMEVVERDLLARLPEKVPRVAPSYVWVNPDKYRKEPTKELPFTVEEYNGAAKAAGLNPKVLKLPPEKNLLAKQKEAEEAEEMLRKR